MTNIAAVALAGEHQQDDPRGAWILTYPTGLKFYPLDPAPDEIRIEDIAHALALVCRYGGHCRRFYSVAEHSVRASYAVLDLLPKATLPAAEAAGRTQLALEALMHDAEEAYPPGDLLRPVKRLAEVAPLLAVQGRIRAVLRTKFGLSEHEPPEVKAVDNMLLATESRDLRAPLPDDDVLRREDAPPRLGQRIDPWPPMQAEQRFLARFRELTT